MNEKSFLMQEIEKSAMKRREKLEKIKDFIFSNISIGEQKKDMCEPHRYEMIMNELKFSEEFRKKYLIVKADEDNFYPGDLQFYRTYILWGQEKTPIKMVLQSNMEYISFGTEDERAVLLSIFYQSSATISLFYSSLGHNEHVEYHPYPFAVKEVKFGKIEKSFVSDFIKKYKEEFFDEVRVRVRKVHFNDSIENVREYNRYSVFGKKYKEIEDKILGGKDMNIILTNYYELQIEKYIDEVCRGYISTKCDSPVDFHLDDVCIKNLNLDINIRKESLPVEFSVCSSHINMDVERECTVYLIVVHNKLGDELLRTDYYYVPDIKLGFKEELFNTFFEEFTD